MGKHTWKIISFLIFIGFIGAISSIMYDDMCNDIKDTGETSIEKKELIPYELKENDKTITGKVENVFDEDFEKVLIVFNFKNKNDVLIAESKDMIFNFKKGQIWCFEVILPDVDFESYQHYFKEFRN